MKTRIYVGAGACALIALIALISLVSGAKGATAAAPSSGLPVDISMAIKASPGALKPGTAVFVTVTLTGLWANSGSFQVGIPGPEELMSPNHKLIKQPNISVWSPVSVAKGKIKVLTFSIMVSPPAGASGPGLWCLDAVAAPNLLNKQQLPPWSVDRQNCYRVVA